MAASISWQPQNHMKHMIGIERHKIRHLTIYTIQCMFIPMHDLPFSNTAPMALMHGHVNEWHNNI